MCVYVSVLFVGNCSLRIAIASLPVELSMDYISKQSSLEMDIGGFHGEGTYNLRDWKVTAFTDKLCMHDYDFAFASLITGISLK